MIIYNSSEDSSRKTNKYQEHIGFDNNYSRSVKVKTSSKKAHKVNLSKKNIKYLKSLGLKVKVN